MVRDLKDKVLSAKRKREKHSAEGTAYAMTQSQGDGEPRELKHKVQFGWSSKGIEYQASS